MDKQKSRRVKAIEQKNKERLLRVNPLLNEGSGIYFLKRLDEQDKEYAYIGQATHILTELAQFLQGSRPIGFSLREHGLQMLNKSGYRDGLRQGRKSLARELSKIAEKHLTIAVRADKQGNKVSQKQYEKFLGLMSGVDTDEKQSLDSII